MTKKIRILEKTPVELNSIVKRPISAHVNTTVLDARDILIRHRISRLVVTFGKRPVGIVTEKDIARSVSIHSIKPITKIILKDIMSKDLITLKDNATIYDCARKMIDNDISSVIIKNSKGQLTGIVTKTDLVSTFLIQSTASLPISKIMTKKVITVSPDDSIFEIQSILINNKISRLVVVKNKKPVGIITYRDFVPAKTFDLYKGFIDPKEQAEVLWSSKLNEFNV
ncbi:MAG: CBS domain-containing protein, partial [Nitrososphaeraceae archaeon]|nr:CBS domain-containing protein [Nitrososphaeraceae archaeon]